MRRLMATSINSFLGAVLLFTAALVSSASATAGPLSDAIKPLQFELLQATFSEQKIARILGDFGQELSGDERRAAALLVAMNALRAEEVEAPDAGERATRFVNTLVTGHPALLGRIDDAAIYQRIPEAWHHESLLAENALQGDLASALSRGIITGYDLRRKGVYENLPAGLTFIYSQASEEHMRQLLALLGSEDVRGWFYLAPKVSAFLYREDWGPASDRVRTLPGGIRVVNGEEIAAMFQFDTTDGLQRFHELVTRYAKKDEKDEPGLIVNAWWQPFYYTDQPFEDFRKISLVVVSAGDIEATLTVVEEKTRQVVDAFDAEKYAVRVDKVWVNPPFFRFLNGDYK